MYKKMNTNLYFFFFVLLLLKIPLPSIAKTHHLITRSNETDRLALLDFKAGIRNDPFGVLSSWNSSIHFCNWYGVTCGRRHQRVTALNLMSNNLAGFISPQIGNISFLRDLTLQNNTFTTQIPPQLGRLHRLQYLRLGNNSLEGHIPANLSSCLSLLHLDLSYNHLSGAIPAAITSLPNILAFTVFRNSLSGQIPPSLGNLSSLQKLFLGENHFTGRIPSALGRLTNLIFFSVEVNEIEGTLPPSIFNLSSMKIFGLYGNQLRGTLPPELGILFPKLQYLGIFENHFSGSIPPSISNATNLRDLILGLNSFSGKVPNLGNLHKLQNINIAGNHLGSAREGDLDFLTSLNNHTDLEAMNAIQNNFGGILPRSIANLSSNKLRMFGLGDNHIVGTLPTGIGNLRSLEALIMSDNRLSGEIPDDIGKLSKLQSLKLASNYFTGYIPSSIGNLHNLLDLTLSTNKLQGRIPPELGKCQNLIRLLISSNDLNGSIPAQLFTLQSLSIALDLSLNRFSGSLPMEIGNLQSLSILDVSQNMLSGDIPTTLGSCKSLEMLGMAGNLFHGIIPASLTSLRGLKYFNISHNNLSGEIPKFLQSFHLEVLDLSYNNLSGSFPTDGVFKNASATSVQGNDMLCAYNPELHLPICANAKVEKKIRVFKPRIIVTIVSSSIVAIVLLSLLISWFSRRKSKGISAESAQNSMLQVSYQSLFEATDGFSPSNLIGNGSFSSVYKGVLDPQTVVAVKVFNLQRSGASRSFMLECEAMRNIRHRNLVKVITVCSSIDFYGDDFKALVYEFMANGNLDQWLHPLETARELNLMQKLNIAIDVACAVSYLHDEHCETSIVHCDLKPSNILLDDDMMAKVGDFGLAKFLSEGITHQSACSFGVRGTVGYAAPEYGMGSNVSTYGDMYSFGILVLEMFTGKRPTDGMFGSDMNLRDYVKMAMAGHDDGGSDMVNVTLNAIFEIGIACSEETARERMEVSSALAKLVVIRGNHQKATNAPLSTRDARVP